jgi:endonuclease/exonuclease/phosphatase family metal-dependent hydrolase
MRNPVIVVLILFFGSSLADTVVPSDAVVNWVNVRSEAIPGVGILIVGHLHPGETAQFLSESGSYYEIRLDSGTTGFVHKAWTDLVPHVPSNIQIASFNIQVFGKAKANKPNVMAELAAIVRKYDIVAVQEIKDKAGNTPVRFLTEINSDGSNYSLLLSERSGLAEDDKSSQEQYAYYFNTEVLTVLSDAGLYEDLSDQFQREPYVARFSAKNGNFTFVLITVHTKPELAVEETKALHAAIQWAQGRFPDEDDFIALGDFNASCDFAQPEDFEGSPIVEQYVWIIPDDADTNVSPSSACAYDRIIITQEAEEDYANRFGIDNSITDSEVSDHFPVWAQFQTNADN